MPDDVWTNTRRAYNTDPTSPTYYPAGEEPTGRYFAPGRRTRAASVYAGRLRADLFFDGPWFSEWDFKFVKRFPFGPEGECGFQRRGLQRVQQHELHAGTQSGQRRERVPHPGAAQRRAHRPVGLAREFLADRRRLRIAPPA